LEEGVYEAAYPLHDQLISEQDAGDPRTWNDRMVSSNRKKHDFNFEFFRNYIIVGQN